MSANDAAFSGIGEAWGLSSPSRFVYQVQMAWDALDAKWNEWVLGYGPENQSAFMRWLGMHEPTWRKMLLTLVTGVIGLIMVISVLLMIRYRPPKKDEAARLYARFVRKTGLDPETGETARVFAERARSNGAVPAATVVAITDAYMDARYGCVEDADERLRTAVAAMR
jgi:hypothetical protein